MWVQLNSLTQPDPPGSSVVAYLEVRVRMFMSFPQRQAWLPVVSGIFFPARVLPSEKQLGHQLASLTCTKTKAFTFLLVGSLAGCLT